MAVALLAALAVGLALWWVGLRQGAGARAAWVPILPALALAAVAGVGLPQAAAAGARMPNGGEQRFDEAALARLRDEGKPVFLYFTADWCLSCKVNERVAIGRPEVARAFAAKGVITMVGDWTAGDARITRFLAAHGRSGVPLYLFYPKGAREPQLLPQVLTPGLLTGLAG
jgi:thiol:disulfide interchange protein